MQSLLNPYIGFASETKSAMEFYQSVFGGHLVMNTFKEFNLAQNPEDGDKIMHAQLTMDNGMTLMASDVPSSMPHETGSQISISLSGDNESELRSYWEKLTDGGTINLPLEQSPWKDYFGMVTDKFGIRWMLNINHPA